MAVSASFTRLHKEALQRLVPAVSKADPRALTAFLAENGTSAATFDADAEIFSVLLPVLAEEYDIDLETSENGIISELAEICKELVLILTPDEQSRYKEDLEPGQFSLEDLADAYEDFTDEEEDEAGEAMLLGIKALYQALSEVDDDYVVVVTIG